MMNDKKKYITIFSFVYLILPILASCTSLSVTPKINEAKKDSISTPSPNVSSSIITTQVFPDATPTTDIFASGDSFGDGYISLIPIDNFKDASSDEILMNLVIQWLNHYKNDSLIPEYKLRDYEVVDITLLKDNSMPQYKIIGAVNYKVEPASIVGWNDAAGGNLYNNWLERTNVFGVLIDGEKYRLKMLPGWGT